MGVPIYIAELAPKRRRGQLVALHAISITGGQVVSYGIAVAFANVPNGWRYMFGLGSLPSLLLVCLIPLLPETPRLLITHGHNAGAILVLEKQYPTASAQEIAAMFTSLERSLSGHQSTSRNHCSALLYSIRQLYTVPSNLRALAVACGTMAIQQTTGFNTLMYYSATLFSRVGFHDPVAVGVVVAGTNFLFTLGAVFYVDRFGRRKFLVYTMWGMGFALIVAAVAFHYIPLDSNLEVKERNIRWPEIVVLVSVFAPPTSRLLSLEEETKLICGNKQIVLYVAFYATGLGNVPWQNCELLPMEIRAVGTALMTATVSLPPPPPPPPPQTY
jgi:SP family myo-inositol transporter-like MFS transporter 13